MPTREQTELRLMLDDALALLEVGDEANTPGTDIYIFLKVARAALDRMDAAAFERGMVGLKGAIRIWAWKRPRT